MFHRRQLAQRLGKLKEHPESPRSEQNYFNLHLWIHSQYELVSGPCDTTSL